MVESILVFQCNIFKQVRHGFFIVNSSYGFGKQDADVHSFDFMALQLLYFMRDCVRHDHLQTIQFVIFQKLFYWRNSVQRSNDKIMKSKISVPKKSGIFNIVCSIKYSATSYEINSSYKLFGNMKIL